MTTGYGGGFVEVMSRRIQEVRIKEAVYPAISSFEEQANLKFGDTVHRPSITLPSVVAYTRGSDITMGTHTITDQNLVVNQQFVGPIQIEDWDELQSSFKLQMEYSEKLARRLIHKIDGDVLGEYASAASGYKVDNAEINAGTAGDGVPLTTGNVHKLFGFAKKILQRNGIVAPKGLFAVVGSDVEQILLELISGKDSSWGDTVGQNGFVGRYQGFDVYVSDAVSWSGRLELPTQPTNNDTITLTVAGTAITFTFVTSIGSTAGNVLIGGSASITRDNLVLALTGGTGVVSQYVALSTANRNLLLGMAATNNTTTNAVDIKAEGIGFIQVAESITAADGVWTAATQIQHQLFGKKGAIDVVVQQKPKIYVKDVPVRLATNVIAATLYGLLTYTEGTTALVDGRVRTSVTPYQ